MARIGLITGGGGKQGRRRKFDNTAVQAVDIVAQLGRMGMPATDSSRLAATLLGADAGLQISLMPGLTLFYRRETHLSDLEARLRDAAEQVVAHRRGRPPVRRR